jgi:hypothetical protein
MSRSYTSSPPQVPPWRVTGLLYCTLLFIRTMERSYIPIKSTKRLVQRFQNCGAPPAEARVVCYEWHLFLKKEIWAQEKIYIFLGTSPGWNILLTTSLLVPVLAANYKQHICRRLKLDKCVIHSLSFMSDLFIWIYSGEGGMKFIKHFKRGGWIYRSLGTSALVSNTSDYPEQGLTCFSSAVSQIPGYNWRESGC